MNYLTLVALVFLVGCATMSYEDLESLSLHCKPVDSEECVTLRKKFDRRIAARERIAAGICPIGTVKFLGRSGLVRCVSEYRIR